jgi:hypothetical protein
MRAHKEFDYYKTILLEKDPYVKFYDERLYNAREVLIWMEETKIWQRMLENCTNRSGVHSEITCDFLKKIVTERIKYYNSNFNEELTPNNSPRIFRYRLNEIFFEGA